MSKTTLTIHSSFTIGAVDDRIYGGFLEHLGRAVYGGVFDPQSSRSDAEGIRQDVLADLRRLKMTAMRYPGGNFVSGYDWLDGVGPKEGRPTKLDLAWQSLETNQFGTNEFLSVCEVMDWTPMMAVNLGTGTPVEARNWMEYCNSPAGTYWANLRREHGREKPYEVKLWCLGNEMDGPWQIGHVSAQDYATRAQQTARLMKMQDPEVELVVCGSCTTGLPSYMEWDRVVLERCFQDVDYISLHRYVGNSAGDSEDYLCVGASIDRQIEEMESACRYVAAKNRSNRSIRLSFDEWNVWYRKNSGDAVDGRGKFAPPLLEEVYNFEDALVVAQFLNSFLRHADTVKIANIAQIVNVIAPVLTTRDDTLLQTIFYTFELISNWGRGTSLQVGYSGTEVESKSYGRVPTIDASAVVDETTLNVFLVNRNVEHSQEVHLDIHGYELKTVVDCQILWYGDLQASNSFESKDLVAPQPFEEVKLLKDGALVTLPPHSFVALRLGLG
jgi:alpha-N-arabinofuranosidase